MNRRGFFKKTAKVFACVALAPLGLKVDDQLGPGTPLPIPNDPYGDISPKTHGSLIKRLMSNVIPTKLEKFGQVIDIKEKGRTIKWRRYDSFPGSTDTLCKGVVANSKRLTPT